ncbi:Integrin alpha-2 [Trinorchestia longiramus]|nr:Integrin alpha-2 [Trinorchestia longiramus]
MHVHLNHVQTDGYRDANRNLVPPNPDEIKDDQWLGVTVKSQGAGGDVLVCAHRYMQRGPGFQWGFGLCYLLNQNLDVTDSMEPCRGKAVAKGHEQYGFCQAGMSGLILEDEVVLGLPGPYTWRGTVHTSNISNNFFFRDKTQYFGPVTENDSPVDKYSYLGYSVTTGHFFGDYVSYVGGAPRSNGTGQVVFFSRAKIGESLLVVDLILDGEMFASSFGFEILGLDINNDKWDDLLVSAPFYRSRHASGAVYLYMNDRTGLKRNSPYVKIEGPPGESRFGFSMTSLGDLNRDGFLDVAIGAPYEDRGAIYIYLGSADGLVVEPSQIIRASNLPGPTYDAFGYALSGGLDMDNNGYPDLLTSSFCSDRVVLIRSRPVVAITTVVLPEAGIHGIDPTKAGCPDHWDSKDPCFSFEACFKMDNDAGTRTGLLLSYNIEERVYRDQPLPRVYFYKDAQQQPSKVDRKISLRPEDMGRHQCTREVAYLNSGSRDVLRPLRFKLSYEIIQREPEPVPEGAPVPNVDDFPILDQREAVKYFEAHFWRDCGDDNECNTDLEVAAAFQLPWDPSRSHQVFELGLRNMAILETSVTNSGDPAYEPNLYVRHHDSMAFSIKESDMGPYLCAPTRSDLVHCTLGNPFTNSTGPLLLAFKPSGFFEQRFIHFEVFANSTSNELTPQKPIDLVLEILKRAEISIKGSVVPEQVFFGGEIVGESAIQELQQIGSEVIHKYVVDNRGPWRADYVDLQILWPHQTESLMEQGKWLLYLVSVPRVDGDGECTVDPSLVDPLKYTAPPPHSSAAGQTHSRPTVSGESSSDQFLGVKSEAEVETRPRQLLPQPEGGEGSVSVSVANKTVTTKVVTSSRVNTIRTETRKSSKSSSFDESSNAVVDKTDSRKQSMSENVKAASKKSQETSTQKYMDYDYENYEYYEEYPDDYYNANILYTDNRVRRKRYARESSVHENAFSHQLEKNGSSSIAHSSSLDETLRNLNKINLNENSVIEFSSQAKNSEMLILQKSNIENFGDVHRIHSRVKRQREAVVQPEAYTDDRTGRTLQVVNLRCTGDIPTAKCIPIRCTIRNLGAESSASIRVVSRLWNATLVEDYAHVNLVNVQSRGELLLPEDLRSRQDQSDDVAVAETKAYANLLEQSQSVPLWVILVSVFAGLLLLALIILLLWKMGFFERRRRPDTRNLMTNGH